jgi:hypothetical protein
MLTQQPKCQLQSEHEWKKQTHTNYKDKAMYNMCNDDGDNNNSIQFFIY